MIVNCTRCGKATVIQRKDYKPNKKKLCHKCKSDGLMTRITNSIKGIFKNKPKNKNYGGISVGN